ncbi:GPI mannosyltransferase 1 [Plenodomus lingam]|uniref:GPI mannosyltransferase 1 n=1 Tax=Leptosphaeria maculans (strain JN3 / isolate v23.1.3 / race Av1-4-5-6-7-8) TaxID=985895 RepID=E4ZTJ6_LEPMJ|nr:similar to GPI mannosyltransferase 1 [Plenodomus lingam JN3]KAH9863236.1 GPI mannosyltransferase 1 [Plenodomus lingam]CBX94852.1 similar to GPI mannosyltransferase 1 [Plenodomus lingam JN3]
MALSTFFRSPPLVFTSSIILRAIFLFYGLWQDANSPMKYTDIDYYVFTDAARFISRGQSPYARDTYRYTPLLAWLIYPTVWPGKLWFSFGKVLFAVGDVGAGWMMYRILKRDRGMGTERALKFASIWLLNPMVATISTRGSSEGLLGVFVTALLWAVLARRVVVAGMLLGFAVHFKIYPFIYAASIMWWLDETKIGKNKKKKNQSEAKDQTNTSPISQLIRFLNPQRITLAISSLTTFIALNIAMYAAYGYPFLDHSYFYHLIRIDHRHNFSPYNTLLYLNSSPKPASSPTSSTLELERLAFLPQLLLSAIFIPLALSKKDLPSTMLAQTFAFVAFNKVCTSQYFLWYMMFLPYYLPTSTLLRSPRIGLTALTLWILGQVAWLQQGFQLEFNGRSTFVPGLFLSGLFFFLVNVGILGVIIADTKGMAGRGGAAVGKKRV